jgi:hypothetical protein
MFRNAAVRGSRCRRVPELLIRKLRYRYRSPSLPRNAPRLTWRLRIADPPDKKMPVCEDGLKNFKGLCEARLHVSQCRPYFPVGKTPELL